MSKTQDYIDRYAQYAMEQMERYGIPASITLAQALLESGKGESRLARLENNHFGIKVTKDWLDNGGGYGVYTDDKPNEKFCSYDSVRDSFEHHSRFIVGNSRYGECLSLPVNDYRGWADGLQKAGYATSKSYSTSLISIIESNNLQKYDQIVLSSPGCYASDYQANLPDMVKDGNYRGLNRDNVVDSNLLANSSSKRQEGQSESYGPEQTSNANNKDEIDKEKGVPQNQSNQIEEGEDFDSWMKKLITGTDEDAQSQSSGMDPITDMVITMFTSLFAIAAMIDNKTPLEQSSEARRAVNDQEIDLMPILKEQSSKKELALGVSQEQGITNRVNNINSDNSANSRDAHNPNATIATINGQSESLMQAQQNQTLPGGMKVEDIQSCKFRVTEQAKATIVVEDNLGRTHSYDVSAKELSNLQSTINSPGINTQQKTMAIVAFIGTSMAMTMDRENNQQVNNSNKFDIANNSSVSTNTIVSANTSKSVGNAKSEVSPTMTTGQESNPTATVTVSKLSTAAQISSRNYEMAENQSISREGQSYSR